MKETWNALSAALFGTDWKIFLSGLISGGWLDWLELFAVDFLMALGVSGCIISGGIDFSGGCQAGFAACLTALFLNLAENPARTFVGAPIPRLSAALAAAFFALLIGALFGLCNAFSIVILKIPPFLATFGAGAVFYAFTRLLADNFYIINIINIENGVSASPVFFLIASAIGILSHIIYQNTRYGRHLYAVGGNIEAAELLGVRVGKVRARAYMTAGMLYAAAGWMAALSGESRIISGAGFESNLISALDACLIGGVSAGFGSVPGIFGGALILSLIKYILRFLNIHPAMEYAVLGVILIFAAALNARRDKSHLSARRK